MTGRPAVAAAVACIALLSLASCSDGDDDIAGPVLPSAPAAGGTVVRDGAYDWRTVPIGGGGFVTGLVLAVASGGTEGIDSADGAGDRATVAYARTDVGGAYRWDPATESWIQLLTVGRAPDVELEPGDYAVASIAVAASDPDVVVVAAGADFDPGEGEDLPRTGRILRSTDGGQTWTASDRRWFVAGNQRFRTGSERLAIDPANPAHLLFGTQREGLWRSTDGGSTWGRVSGVPDGVVGDGQQAGVATVTFLAAVGDRPAVAIAGVVGVGMFASDDGGETWQRTVELAAGALPSSPTPAGDGLLLAVDAVGEQGGTARIVRLGPDGRQAAELDPPATSTRWLIAADPADPERLVATDDAVRDGHLWTSSDGGGSWQSHDIETDPRAVPWLSRTDLETYMTAGRLAWDPVETGRLWFAEGMGVWRTDDLAPATPGDGAASDTDTDTDTDADADADTDTVRWASIARGIEETVVSSIIAPPGGVPIITVADRQGFRIEDLDAYPTATLVDPRFASGSGVDFSAGAPARMAWVGAESNVFDASQAEPRGAVSTDGGASWDEMGGLEQAMFGGEIAVSATDPDVLVWLPTHFRHPYQHLDTPVGVYSSDNGGRQWEQVAPDGDVDSFHRFFWWFTRRALAADRVNGDFYLLSDEERFYRSSDGGRSWERTAHAPPCTEAVTCHVFGQVQAVPGEAGHLWASTGQGGLHRSEDAGATPWTPVEGIAEARAFSFGAPIGGGDVPTVFVYGRASADDRLALWRSVDGGESWQQVSATPNGLAADINAIAGDPDRPGRVYVGFAGAGAVVGDDPSL